MERENGCWWYRLRKRMEETMKWSPTDGRWLLMAMAGEEKWRLCHRLARRAWPTRSNCWLRACDRLLLVDWYRLAKIVWSTAMLSCGFEKIEVFCFNNDHWESNPWICNWESVGESGVTLDKKIIFTISLKLYIVFENKSTVLLNAPKSTVRTKLLGTPPFFSALLCTTCLRKNAITWTAWTRFFSFFPWVELNDDLHFVYTWSLRKINPHGATVSFTLLGTPVFPHMHRVKCGVFKNS
jgi:hypothetical protein